MELETLVNECASVGLGEHLYREVLRTVRAVVLGRRYSPAYSPTGRWDEDAFTALAHDWIMKKLLQYRQLEHLLLSNQTMRGFRKGLELSFVDFLIGQKKRTALDNLFHRASAILQSDPASAVLLIAPRRPVACGALPRGSMHNLARAQERSSSPSAWACRGSRPSASEEMPRSSPPSFLTVSSEPS